jgi:hypothetical protein
MILMLVKFVVNVDQEQNYELGQLLEAYKIQ